MKTRPVLLWVSWLGFGAAMAPVAGSAVEADASLKLQAAGVFEGARDLGTGQEDSTNIGQLEAFPALHIQWAPHFATYVRGQGFVATDTNSQIEQNRTVRQNSFAALREAWFEFDNLAGYPGQFLRFGRQRIKEPDALWWDEDIEAVRWAIDSTLIQAQLGVAEQFDTYRTDNTKLAPDQDHRPYFLSGISGQWFPGHFIGIRGALADDRVTLPPPGTPVNSDTHTKDRRLGWIGLHVENGYYDYQNPHPAAYWGEILANAGFQRIADSADTDGDPTTPETITQIRNQHVKAFGADTGLRFRLPLTFPMNIGIAYAFGEGGNTRRGRSETFDQTGLQSNRSRFTGTRSLVNRFNEALRADLSNLRVISGFVSLPFEQNDASFVISHFARDDRFSPIVTKGLDVQPTPGQSHDLGNGYDLVVAHYFMNPVRKSYSPADEDTRDNLRLRASLFDPGNAYGSTPRNNQYYVVLEATLWF